MADVKWIKITTDLFDDEKIKLIDVLPARDAIIVTWFKLLALAGKTNDNGLAYVMKEMATTDEVLATVFNRPVDTIRLALATFEKFGMIEQHKHISITNWDKHQNIDGLDKIREQNRLRQQKRREKQKLLDSNVISRDSHATELDKELELELDKNKSKSKKERKNKINIHIQEEWNRIAKECNLSKIKILTKKRTDELNTRLKELSEEEIIEAINKIKDSNFLKGIKNDWKVTFDWLITNDTNIIKVLEDNYKSKDNESAEKERLRKREEWINEEDDLKDAEII